MSLKQCFGASLIYTIHYVLIPIPRIKKELVKPGSFSVATQPRLFLSLCQIAEKICYIHQKNDGMLLLLETAFAKYAAETANPTINDLPSSSKNSFLFILFLSKSL